LTSKGGLALRATFGDQGLSILYVKSAPSIAAAEKKDWMIGEQNLKEGRFLGGYSK